MPCVRAARRRPSPAMSPPAGATRIGFTKPNSQIEAAICGTCSEERVRGLQPLGITRSTGQCSIWISRVLTSLSDSLFVVSDCVSSQHTPTSKDALRRRVCERVLWGRGLRPVSLWLGLAGTFRLIDRVALTVASRCDSDPMLRGGKPPSGVLSPWVSVRRPGLENGADGHVHQGRGRRAHTRSMAEVQRFGSFRRGFRPGCSSLSVPRTGAFVPPAVRQRRGTSFPGRDAPRSRTPLDPVLHATSLGRNSCDLLKRPPLAVEHRLMAAEPPPHERICFLRGRRCR
jgi:hypothetical protein